MHTVLRMGAAGALVLACTAAARADILLDTFVERGGLQWPNSINVTSPTLTPSDPETALVTVLGGQRDSALGVSTMDIPNFDTATADIYNQNGLSFFDYQSSVGAAATAQLAYGGGAPLNLVDVNGIVINFLDYDASRDGPLHVTVTLFHQVPASSEISAQFSADLTAAGAQSLLIPVGGFAGDVDRVVFDFVAPKGTDYRIDSLAVTVPEPGTLAALGLTGLALLLRRRRS